MTWNLVLVALLAGATTAAWAPEPAAALGEQATEERVEADYRRLVGELMSPFCQGLTLENCPTSGAAEMRRQIHDWLVAGKSPDEVIDLLVDEWGEAILGAPRFRGIGILAWILPGVAAGVAGAWVALWLRRRAGNGRDGDGPPAEISAQTRERLERETAALIVPGPGD